MGAVKNHFHDELEEKNAGAPRFRRRRKVNAVSNVTQRYVKTLDDVMADVGELYDELQAGRIAREDAAELANIAGKYTRARALKLAEAIFEAGIAQRRLNHG